MTSTSETETLDWRGLTGPEAIVNTARKVKGLGNRPRVLHILADDQTFPADIESWCRATRSELVRIDQDPAGGFAALVRVNSPQEEPASSAPVPAPGPGPASSSTTGREGMKRLDYRGMQCPAPILELARAVRELNADSEIEVLADDRAFPMDLHSWCRSTGAQLVSLDEEGGVHRAVLRVQARQTGESRIPSRPQIALPVTRTQELPDNGELRMDLGGMPAETCAAVLESIGTVDMAGMQLTVTATHDLFAQDLVAWCARRGHALVRLDTQATPMTATVRLRSLAEPRQAGQAGSDVPLPAAAGSPAAQAGAASDQCTLLMLHSDMEALLAALMMANTAAASGMRATIFFAFWGLNVLRGDRPRQDVPAEKVSLLQRMFKWMMPRGPRRQHIGKLSFGGMGGGIMRRIMKRKNLLLAEEHLEQACALGVRFVVCTMSMSVMGITQRDLMDLPNIEFAGVTSFVGDARGAGLSLVF